MLTFESPARGDNKAKSTDAKTGGRRPRRQKPVRLVDVAKAADVSIATVSMVINDNPRISRITAERVKRIIDRLGYRASGSPASHTRTKTGLLVASICRSTVRRAHERAAVGHLQV